MRGEPLKGHLDLLLLVAISSGRTHGYAIADHLRSESSGAFDLPEGTIYPALHRLEESGLVKSKWTEVRGRRRRLYELTRSGERELTRKRGEWDDFETAVRAILNSS